MRLFLLAFTLPIALSAQTSMEQLTEQLGKTVLYSDLALSPDGAHLAWVQSTASSPLKQTSLRALSGDGTAAPVNLGVVGSADRSDADPAWSPDSTTLVLFSTAGEKDGQRQLWSVRADGSNPKKLTQLKGYAARPKWSHDGKQIAFLYLENAGGGGPLFAAEPNTGVIDTAIHNQRIAVLDFASGKVRQVSPENLHVYDYDWSPDDKQFVVSAAPGPGDNNWWIAQIQTVNIDSGVATSIYKPKLQVATPRWSPDGKSIAFVEGIMSDEGFHGGDLLTVDSSGKAASDSARNLTAGRTTSVNSFFWQGNDKILLVEYVGGGGAFSELNVRDNSVVQLYRGDDAFHAFGNFPDFTVSADGKTTAVVRSAYHVPPEIWSGPINSWKQLTSGNSQITPSWGKGVSLEWKSDSYNIQGWLVSPTKVEQGRKHPMVVLIHGGPSSVSTPEWPAGFGMSRAIIAALSQHGYYVLLPNPRGSYGQGEDFTRANVKDFGHGDLRDIMAGVDAAIAKYPIDPDRLGVTGWSYGGFMTMWTVTQTNRFKAAVTGAGIANWESYYGQNLIGEWMIPFFGASVYDDPAVYQKSSPIKFIKNVKTPTLVVVGERDAECPAPQSYEFWRALKALGVPTQLIIYPGEGHMFVNPKNQSDRLEQFLRWFEKYLK